MVVILSQLLCSCEGNEKNSQAAERVVTQDIAMGTVVSLTIYPKDEQEAQEAKALEQRILEELWHLERDCLSRKADSSEVYKINQHAGDLGEMPVSEELGKILEECRQMTEDSDGAFDVSIGALVTLWKIDEVAAGDIQGSVPSREAVEKARSCVGMDGVILENGCIRLKEGMMLDFGSVGKGIALDHVEKMLRDGGDTAVPAGVFALGGSIYVYGNKPDGTPWRIAVKDPFSSGGNVGVLEVPAGFKVSTSGDYERFFEADGRRYSHILDPATGYPADSGLCSVTILSESGFLSDALSTACYVLGKEKGSALAEKYHAEYLFVDENGEIFMSNGMKSRYFSENGVGN